MSLCELLDGWWEFHQVKTRDPGKPWRLSDLCARKGALWALLRTYRVVEPLGINYRLYATLVGHAASGDVNLAVLAGGSGGDNSDVRRLS